MTDQAAMQRVLDGQSPHAGTNPRHAAAAALTQGAAVRVSLDLAATSEAERAALLVDLFSVPSERAAQWSSSLQSAGLRVDADGQRGLTLAMNVLARDPAIVTELVPAVRTSIGRWLGQLREGLDEVNRQFASTPLWSPEEFADARTLLTRVAEGTQTESEGPRATLRIALAPEGVTALTSYAQRSYTRYQQLLAEIEVSTLTNEIAHLVGAYATTPERPNARPRGRLPASAPRVPAEVPRGTFVRLTPDAWSHPAWRAIGFAPAVLTRTRASYEVEVRGTRFTVRGLTDLDGDGTPSTFEQSGRLDARRQPQYDAPRTVNAAH